MSDAAHMAVFVAGLCLTSALLWLAVMVSAALAPVAFSAWLFSMAIMILSPCWRADDPGC